jgi:hypothetical protein
LIWDKMSERNKGMILLPITDAVNNIDSLRTPKCIACMPFLNLSVATDYQAQGKRENDDNRAMMAADHFDASLDKSEQLPLVITQPGEQDPCTSRSMLSEVKPPAAAQLIMKSQRAKAAVLARGPQEMISSNNGRESGITFQEPAVMDDNTPILFYEGKKLGHVMVHQQSLTHDEMIDEENTIVWSFKRITALMLEWENGEIMSEPLVLIAADDPITCANIIKQ